MKFVFPIIWISGFGAGAFFLWWTSASGDTGPNVPPPEMKWQFLGAWIIGTGFILWFCAGLKRVRVDSEHLFISNYRSEIAVPLRQVADVTELRWMNVHPVTIHFRSLTEFGQKVSFMPTTRVFGWWSAHPVVAELKELARLS